MHLTHFDHRFFLVFTLKIKAMLPKAKHLSSTYINIQMCAHVQTNTQGYDYISSCTLISTNYYMKAAHFTKN